MNDTSQIAPKLLQTWATLQQESATLQLDAHGTIRAGHASIAELEPSFFQSLPRLDSRPMDESSIDSLSDFRISRTLGEGGMGIVCLARQRSLHRDVAIKTIRPDRRNESTTRDILREAWVTGLLEHPNIVPVHTLGLDEAGSPMLVMKRIEGVSWRDAMENPKLLPSRFHSSRDNLDAHLQILIQVCNAVQFAHSKGILHRDLKPDNVMLGPFGEVYLLDWGIAVSMVDDGTGRLPLARDVASVAGTPAYLAPELASGRGEDQDARTDVYLLGAILHEIITGSGRHNGPTLMAILVEAYKSEPVSYSSAVPEELAQICNRATARAREDRYADAEAFCMAVSDFMQHRDSHILTQESLARLKSLEASIAFYWSEHHNSDDLSQESQHLRHAYTLYAECRFGFEQALRVWSDNVQAGAGLQKATTQMARLELGRKNASAAAMFLSALTNPDPALLEQLREIEDRARREGQELDRLKRIGRDTDISLGMRSRAWVALALGTTWGAARMATAVRMFGRTDIDHVTYYVSTFAFAVFFLAVVVVPFRRKLFATKLNRQIVSTLVITIAVGVVLRIVCAHIGLPISTFHVMENLLFALTSMHVSNFADYRLAPHCLGFLSAALCSAFLPAYAIHFSAMGIFVSMGIMALVWYVLSHKSEAASAEAN